MLTNLSRFWIRHKNTCSLVRIVCVLYLIYFVKQFHSLNIYFMGSYYDAMHLMQLNHKFHFSPSMIAIIMIGVFHWRICKWCVSQPQVHSARKRIELELKLLNSFRPMAGFVVAVFSIYNFGLNTAEQRKWETICVCLCASVKYDQYINSFYCGALYTLIYFRRYRLHAVERKSGHDLP